MKYFKHATDMRNDVKIRRIVRTFGAEGYAIYNYVLEAIVYKIEAENPEPYLEDTAEDIAYYFNMEEQKVQEILEECVKQGLFVRENGVISCPKVFKYLDKASTSSSYLRDMIENCKSNGKSPSLRYEAVGVLEEKKGTNKQEELRDGGTSSETEGIIKNQDNLALKVSKNQDNSDGIRKNQDASDSGVRKNQDVSDPSVRKNQDVSDPGVRKNQDVSDGGCDILQQTNERHTYNLNNSNSHSDYKLSSLTLNSLASSNLDNNLVPLITKNINKTIFKNVYERGDRGMGEGERTNGVSPEPVRGADPPARGSSLPDSPSVDSKSGGHPIPTPSPSELSPSEPPPKSKKEKLKKPYDDLGLVKLTDEEYDYLVTRYGSELLSEAIDKLSAYKQAKGRVYKSDAGALRTWAIPAVLEKRERKHSREGPNPFKYISFEERREREVQEWISELKEKGVL